MVNIQYLIYGNKFIDSRISEFSQKQEFAVVAIGPIKSEYIEFSESSECPCEKCNQNHPEFCLCNKSSEHGPHYQAKIETFYGTNGSFELEPLAIKYIKIISP